MRNHQPGIARGRGGAKPSQRGREGLSHSDFQNDNKASASACVVCGASDAKYKFVCCRKRFCGTSCYQKHKSEGCAAETAIRESKDATSQLSPSNKAVESQASDQSKIDNYNVDSNFTEALQKRSSSAEEETLTCEDIANLSSDSSSSSDESGGLSTSSDSSDEADVGKRDELSNSRKTSGRLTAETHGSHHHFQEQESLAAKEKIAAREKRPASSSPAKLIFISSSLGEFLRRWSSGWLLRAGDFCLSRRELLKKLALRVKAVAAAASVSHDEGIASLAVHLGDSEFQTFVNELMDAVLRRDSSQCESEQD